MVDKKLSEFSSVQASDVSDLVVLYLDGNNTTKNGRLSFSAFVSTLALLSGSNTFTGTNTFLGDTVFSGNATFNQTVNANVSGSSSSCTGNSATATKATQDASGNNIADTYATKTELTGKADIDLSNINASASAKQTIVGWGMPDYDSGVLYTSTRTYTATEKCFVIVYSSCYNGKNFYLYINGENITIIGQTSFYPNYVYLYLDVGDVITCGPDPDAANWDKVFVYPLKGL